MTCRPFQDRESGDDPGGVENKQAMAKANERNRPLAAVVLELGIVFPVLSGLGIAAWRDSHRYLSWETLFPLILWALILAGTELLPVPAWRGLNLSLGFPIRLGLAT